MSRDSGVLLTVHRAPTPNSPRYFPTDEDSFFLPAQPSASLATCPADPALSGWRPTSQGLTVSLVPPMGDGDVMQVVTDSLHDFVGFVRVVICGDTELVQSLGVDSQHVGDESVDSGTVAPIRISPVWSIRDQEAEVPSGPSRQKVGKAQIQHSMNLWLLSLPPECQNLFTKVAWVGSMDESLNISWLLLTKRKKKIKTRKSHILRNIIHIVCPQMVFR